MNNQSGWRSCPKCQGMYFGGFDNFKGVCPAGGPHDETNSFAYLIPFDSDSITDQIQAGWRSCPKCQGMHFAGFDHFKGVCPADGGAHTQTNSFAYVMVHDIPPQDHFQIDWRSCRKCQGLFFGPLKGRCPAGGGEHDGTGSFNYALPLQGLLPPSLQFDVDSIVLDGGSPVGGFTHLTLRQNGSYSFSGHFHDSGATEFNVNLVCAVKDFGNHVYTFQHSGHVAGTFEPGSRDDDWSIDGQNDAIAQHWTDLAISAKETFHTSATVDLVNLTNSIIGALGLVASVINIVQAASGGGR